MRIKILILLMLAMPFCLAGDTGMNYYTTTQHNQTITSPNQTYQLAFIMDDVGTMASTPAVADIDGDGVNESIWPEYSGRFYVWNWTGLAKGSRESKRDLWNNWRSYTSDIRRSTRLWNKAHSRST